MAIKVRPLHDRIIVQRLEEEEQQVGGIIIPDTAKEKPQQGKVVAMRFGGLGDTSGRDRFDAMRPGLHVLDGLSLRES